MPYEVIPGCHGTGDGNQFDHNSVPVPESFDKKDLSGVQNLVLRRWIDFIFPDSRPDPHVDLGHEALDAVANNYLTQDGPGRNKQLLENYSHIQEHIGAFEWLATRNYKGLGRYMEQRQVHFHQRGNTPITDLDAHGDGKRFSNLQHVQLWMSNQLSAFNFFQKTLPEQVEWLQKNIENAFKVQDLSQSLGDQTLMIASLLQNQRNHPLLIESLSFLVNTITQTYMRNHLSVEEQTTFKLCVERIFEILKYAAVPENSSIQLSVLAKSFETTIRHDLTATMLQHQKSLLTSAQKLSRDQKALIPESIEYEEGITWLINAQKLLLDDLQLLSE